MAFLIPLVVAVVGQAIKNEVDASQQREQEERIAKERAEKAIREQAEAAKQAADAAAQEALQKLQQEQGQVDLMSRVFNACREGDIPSIRAFIQQLDNPHFTSLGQRLLAEARDEETLAAVDEILGAERARRGMT